MSDLKTELEKLGYADVSTYLNSGNAAFSSEKTDREKMKGILEAVAELIGPVSEGLEKIQIVEDVIFWTFEKVSYRKCNWWKGTAKAGVAEKLTIRMANTIRKYAV